VSSVDAPRPFRPPRFTLVPKPGGGERHLTALDPLEDATYCRVVGRLAGMLERVLGPEVMAHRVASTAPLTLRPWREERGQFERRRRALIEGDDIVVTTDIRECYPSMRPDVVERAFARLGAERDDVRPLRRILEDLADRGVTGLPIGPVASAVVANAVLAAVDRGIRSASAPHLRWVDDVWATCRDERHASEVLHRIREALDAIGLSVNEPKTRVMDRTGAFALLADARPADSGCPE
jgi:reverse transcriptase-like protein